MRVHPGSRSMHLAVALAERHVRRQRRRQAWRFGLKARLPRMGR